MSVSSRLKRLTAGAIGFVAAVAVGLAVAPYFVSNQEARLAAMRAMRAATGAEPQIAGAVHLSLLPTPSVRIEEVRLAGDERPPFAAAAVRATVRLLPLFYGRVEIAALTFEHPHLAVEASPKGGLIVGVPIRSAAKQRQTDMPEIRFERGTVQFRDTDGSVGTLSDVEGAVAWSGPSVNASGTFRWHGQPTTFNVTVADAAALEAGNRSGLRARIDGEDLKFGFDGGLAYRNGLQADGVVALEARSLRTLLSRVAGHPPLTRAGFGAFKLKGQIAVASASASISKLAVELDGNRSEGGLTVKRAGERLVVQATLASEHADFTPYSGGLSMTDKDGNDWSREPIDLSGLDAVDLDVRFSAARVTVRKTELTRVAATATMRNGSLVVTVGDAGFHGGALRGRATLGRNAAGEAEIEIEGDIAKFDLGPSFTAVAGIPGIEGKGTLNFTLQGSGGHMHAITRDLSGAMTLVATAGSLTGVNVEQALRRLRRDPFSAAASELGGGKTSFERLRAKINIHDGTARVEDARVESPQMQVLLTGEASVVERDFDLRGTAKLMRTSSAKTTDPSFELPFLVRGSWARPYLLPDPATLFQRSGDGSSLGVTVGRQAAYMLDWRDETGEPTSGLE